MMSPGEPVVGHASIEQMQLQRYLHLLHAENRLWPASTTLWSALAEVFPHRPTGPAERQLLLAVLTALAEQGEIRLPAVTSRRWDHSLEPAVPRSVQVPQPTAPASAFDWRGFPWHPHLQWIASLHRLNESQQEFLQRVHEGLVQDLFAEPASLRHRSLQLTGDEKRLESFLKSALFRPGRLSIELLGCLPDTTPLAWESVGPGKRLLIVENAGAFAAARRTLGGASDSAYGLLAYGAGRAIEASLGYLLTLRQQPTGIEYLGDLDATGLHIAQAVARRAEQLGLPPVRPAGTLHAAMLNSAVRFGHPSGWPAGSPVAAKQAAELASFLPESIAPRVAALLEAGRRIPEEVLGADDWLLARSKSSPAERNLPCPRP